MLPILYNLGLRMLHTSTLRLILFIFTKVEAISLKANCLQTTVEDIVLLTTISLEAMPRPAKVKAILLRTKVEVIFHRTTT
jgi:hypothetical protein